MIRNLTRGSVLATDVQFALSVTERTRGLLDHDFLPTGHALFISPCTSVHMFGMRFSIDVAFVARSGRVVRAISDLQINRASWIYLRARHAIELPAGTLAATGTQRGDQLDWPDVPGVPAPSGAR